MLPLPTWGLAEYRDTADACAALETRTLAKI